MKIRNRKMTPWLTALACLTLVPATRATNEADAPAAPTTQNPGDGLPYYQEGLQPADMAAERFHEGAGETQLREGAPTRANKASGLLGMDVRNQNNEHLGHIKDIVFNWKTEQVSYAVIGTPKAFLGIGEKLLAVPLTALTPSEDRNYLVLNADKSAVKTAMGFNRDNWPSVDSPSWGAQPFWQEEPASHGISDQPAQDLDTKAKPGTSQETKPAVAPEKNSDAKPDLKPDQEPSKPDTEAEEMAGSHQESEGEMEHDSQSDDMDPDSK